FSRDWSSDVCSSDLVAGGFQFGFSCIYFYRSTHVFHGEIIQHDDVRTGGEGLLEFVQRFYFDFHRFARGDLTGGGDGVDDTAAGSDVVFFNEKGIVETDAVIVATAAGDGVFLGGAEAGESLAGVEQVHERMGDL